MLDRVTPGAFYGAAIAALCGLLLGLILQDPWQKHPGGPQILFNSAAAAELARPAKADDASAPPENPQAAGNEQLAGLDAAYNDPGYIAPDPLPVTRLDPDRFDVKPAAAEPAELDGGGDDEAQQQTADAAVASAAPDTSGLY